MALQATTLYDGFASLEGGMDAGIVPTNVQPNQNAFAVNASHRGGYVRQRPFLIGRDIDFDRPESQIVWWQTYNYRCAQVYYPDVGNPLIVASVGGIPFSIDVLDGYKLTSFFDELVGEYSLALQGGWMCQAERWLIIQDGQSRPILFDGASIRFAAVDEVKAGSAMCYAQGRIWYASPEGNTFRATDLVYSDGTRAAVLKETENAFLNGGGDFVVPSTSGRIRAIVAPGQLDTSLGQGPVHVLTDKSVFSVNAPIDREIWQNLSYPIQTFALVGNGAVGSNSTLVHNGDIFYRSLDGMRSYVLARRDFGQWGNAPISRELGGLLEADNQKLLRYGSSVVWHNWLITTCAPVQGAYGVVHRGLAVLDLDLGNGMQRKLPPAWDGLWTGLDVYQIFTGIFNGEERCFVLARVYETPDWGPSLTSQLRLFELVDDSYRYEDKLHDEATYTSPVEWSFETRAMSFGKPYTLKRLSGGRLFVDQINGPVEFTVSYRPDGYPAWITWQTWTDNCSHAETCSKDECSTPADLQETYKAPYTLGEPPPTCVSTNNSTSIEGYEFQVKVEVTGKCRIRKAVFMATELNEPVRQPSCGTLTCNELDACVGNKFSYEVDVP